MKNMKKIYLMFFGLSLSAAASAYVDSLVSHFTGTPTLIGSSGGGYVSGSNDYGDLSKMQLFDNTYGVAGPGTISKVLLWIPVKEQVAGSFMVNIWSDVAGTPGAVLGTTTLTIASVDTSIAGLNFIDGVVPYNVTATFGTAVAIPANMKFWAGVILPTTNGDTLGLASTSDGDFTDALTHTGEYWSDLTFHTFGDPGNWDLAVALAIFPVVTITSVAGVEENAVVTGIYPNPTKGAMTFSFGNTETSYVMVRDLSGRTVATVEVNSAMTVAADFSELANGTYIYETVNFDGVVTSKSKFVKQ